ncbi:RagB/SusD family nutrient uptake outer membrane protein [Desertivirga brevis]|uniref:RagB/SusD family nutrient uptake outer membrane protein n=1 Tax=Desertivirga brevis TaxID=2810310 RepID=UPI001A95FFAA|nr:RagB/SusD family nutrient uptake outer membrane protein [Pedobacter sp. SYSU D00873]
MKHHIKLIYSLALACVLMASCNKEVLDRPPLTDIQDDPTKFWRNEDDARLFANGFYPNYFVGYNTGFGTDYTPVRGYTFSDDLTARNVQSNFESTVPVSRAPSSTATIATLEAPSMLTQYAGPTWNFAWVRKSNLFLDRLQNIMEPKLAPEAYKHWTAVGRFFRGFEYSRLVSVFGDVPYYDKVLGDTDWDQLYKDRDSRGFVMDKVYEDFKYALANMRENDGAQNLNKYIAAAFISRLMLFEGTFEHYHNLDAVRAKKYLELAVEAAEVVINSNKYNFTRDFKSIFSSESLAGHPEVLLYRTYDATLGVTHSIGSYQNGTESMGVDANLVFIKSFLVNDGKVWQNSTTPGAASFTIGDLIKTRDPRFEASFIDRALDKSTTLLYGYKFASREAITFIGKTYPAAWGSNTNTSDAPVIRLAEVVLNWIEAKAVLAEYFAGPAITQADLNKSINAIRNRPLDAAAIAKGVQKTVPLTLATLPDDPARDADVPALVWEIRRERRMEFVFEHTRLLDLKRWKKIQYMDFSKNPDYFLGPWVNVKAEVPGVLTATNVGKVRVKKADGTVVTYNGSNAEALVGFWMVENASNRNSFSDAVYMSPVGQNQIIQYKERGYNLTQTVNW